MNPDDQICYCYHVPMRKLVNHARRVRPDFELAGRDEVHFPKRLSWPLKVFTALPRPLFEWLAGKLMVRR